MSILRTRRAAIMTALWFFPDSIWRRPIVSRSLLICLRCWALKVGRCTFSSALASFTPAMLALIVALMLRVTLGRRGLTHPRREHFQVDQFVEFDRGFGHASLLPPSYGEVNGRLGL